MVHRMGAAGAAMVAALAVAVGAGPAAAGPAEDPAPAPATTGWVVEGASPDGLFDTPEGSVTITGLAGGATISCPLVDGWGRADNGTLRPQDWFGETGVTSYGSCAGSDTTVTDVFSSPGMAFLPETYDAGTDRISGLALPLVWGLFVDAPDCQIDLYTPDNNTTGPLTYDNPTSTLAMGPVEVVVYRAEGAGCAGLAAVGDEATFETTFTVTPGFTVRPA